MRGIRNDGALTLECTSAPLRKLAAHGPSLHPLSHPEIIEVCLAAGFAGIEGHAYLFANLSARNLEKLREKYNRNGLQISSFHLPYEPDVAALDESVRLDAVATLKTALRKTALLGVRVAVLHPTASRCDVGIVGFEPLLNALEKSLSALLPIAEAEGVIIALENIPPYEMERFGSRPEHFRRFKERFAHPFLGFCLDTGHALLSLHDRAFEMAEVMKSHIQALHLQDNAGNTDSHLAPGRGLVDWETVGRILREIHFTHPACIEAPPFAYGPDYSQDAWNELRSNTARLLPL